MADRDLNIHVKYDTSSGDASLAASAKKTKAVITELLTDEQVAEKAKLEAIKKTNAARVQEVMKAGKEESRSSKITAEEIAQARGMLSSETINKIKAEQQARQQADNLAKINAKQRFDIERFQMAESHRQRMEAWDTQQKKQQELKTSGADMIKTMMGLAAVRSIAMGIAADFKQTAEEIHESAKGFQELRAAMQQIAALKGEQNQTKFTLAQVSEAQAAGLTPQEWIQAQEQFQSVAGAYLEGPAARMDQKQGAAYEQKIASFAKARGMAQDEAQGLGGALLQFSAGKQTPEDLMKRYGKVYKTLERAPSKAIKLLPQMSRVMSQGFSPEEASQALAIMSEAMPGEEETGVENTMRAITAARLKGKGERLGVKKGMSPMQQIEAASRALRAMEQQGVDIDELMKEFAPDARERRGILGFMNKGVTEGGFERVRGYATDTPDDWTETETKNYLSSDAGVTNAIKVAAAAEKARMGARGDPILQRRQIAETELMKAGAFENVPMADRVRGQIIPMAEDRRTQQVNRKMLAMARAEIKRQMVQMGRGGIAEDFEGADRRADAVASLSSLSTDNTMRDLMKQIERNTRQLNPNSGVPAALPGAPAPVPTRPP